MASSGSFNTSAYQLTTGTRLLTFSWEETSQSVSTNTTVISWKLVGGGTDTSQYAMSGNFKVVIAGTTVFTKTDRIKLYNGTVVASGTATLIHNADGTKSFTASVEAGIYNVAVNCSGSKTFTLDTIARASQPSCITYPDNTQDVGNFGDTISIHMNRKSADFTHTVRYAFGDLSGTCINAETGKEATGIGTGFKWKIPESFMNLLPTATSGSGRIYVDTYNGSTKIGTKYTGFTAHVPASAKPDCTIYVVDDTNILATYGNLVRGLSKLNVKTTFIGSYGSTVKSYSVSANGVKYDKERIVTGYISDAGTTTVTATVKDSRGRTSDEKSATFTVLDYSKPNISSLSVHRCNKNGTANDRGEYVKILFSGNVTPLNNKNTATYTVRYKKTSATSWTNIVTDENGNAPSSLAGKYSVENQSYIFKADGSSSYDVDVTVSDKHHSYTRRTSASTAFTLINCNEFGDAIGFGGVAEERNTFKNNLNLIQRGNRFAFFSSGVAGESGYVLMARITHKNVNADTPITFVFTQRIQPQPMIVHVRFKTDGETIDPGLESITYEGSNYGAYIVRSAASVWDLYVKKVFQYDTITLQDWYSSRTMQDRVSVEFAGNLVSSVPGGLDGYYRATPAIPQSIIDCLLPVGMIIQLYSHADPNDMYPGTTWVRLANTFLWGCDASGTIGQTGGEKTHTLTVNELPEHSHGSVYSAQAEGTKSQAWYSTSGDKLSYGAVKTGGSAAHNNMPPYTQVSIWRRTA